MIQAPEKNREQITEVISLQYLHPSLFVDTSKIDVSSSLFPADTAALLAIITDPLCLPVFETMLSPTGIIGAPKFKRSNLFLATFLLDAMLEWCLQKFKTTSTSRSHFSSNWAL
jgi:hypothetical protein